MRTIKEQARGVVVGLGLLTLAVGGCDSGGKEGEPKAKTAAKGKGTPEGGAKAADPGGDAPAKVGDAPAKSEGGAVETDDGGGEAEPPAEGDLVASLDKRVQRAAKLAKEIEKRPTEADDILAAADIDREGFEDLIYAIGADPALSKQYQLALTTD